MQNSCHACSSGGRRPLSGSTHCGYCCGRGGRARARMHMQCMHIAHASVFTRDYYITVQYVQVQVSRTGLNWICSLFNAHCIHVADKLVRSRQVSVSSKSWESSSLCVRTCLFGYG